MEDGDLAGKKMSSAYRRIGATAKKSDPINHRPSKGSKIVRRFLRDPFFRCLIFLPERAASRWAKAC